jgi:hypothetical protein
MIPFITALTVSISLLIIYIVFTIIYKNVIQRSEMLREQEEKEQLLSKYVSEDKKELMKQKLEKITQIVRETEEHIKKSVSDKLKMMESQSTQKMQEEELIDEAGKDYNIYIAELRSAMPKSDEELNQDIKILKEAIEKLESFDKSYYQSESKEPVNVGIGMFYEKMARKFNSLIKEQKINEFSLIPIQRLKYHAITEIKNIKDPDFLPILNLMKDTKLITDIIEIDASFHIIVLYKESPQFSNAEKVLLSFVYNTENLTLQRILELTDWDFTYADKVIQSLVKKEIIIMEKDYIVVKSFGTYAERQKWNKAIENSLTKEKEKIEINLKRQLELKDKLKSSLEQVLSEKTKLSKLKKESVKVAAIDDSKAEEKLQIKFKGKPKVKDLPQSKKKSLANKIESLELPSSFENLQKEDLTIKEIISQKVLGFHEKFSLMNGGFSQYEKIKDFINQEINDVSEDILKEVLTSLIDLKLISKYLKIDQYEFYLFKNMDLSNEETTLITFAINKNPMKKVDFKKGLKWKEEKVLAIMKSLQKKRILRIESDTIIIPGIIQKA